MVSRTDARTDAVEDVRRCGRVSRGDDELLHRGCVVGVVTVVGVPDDVPDPERGEDFSRRIVGASPDVGVGGAFLEERGELLEERGYRVDRGSRRVDDLVFGRPGFMTNYSDGFRAVKSGLEESFRSDEAEDVDTVGGQGQLEEEPAGVGLERQHRRETYHGVASTSLPGYGGCA